ncbi:MAG: ABC transporter permease [Catenulispora sp.]|nr:ABC transporter permease [Catenulispora sp.]
MSLEQLTRLPLLAGRLVRPRRRGHADPVLIGCGLICAGLLALALIGPVLTPYPLDQTDILNASQGPSAEHLLGTDSLGRDLLSRLLAGARPSITAPAVIVLASTTLGVIVAVFAAWRGGRVDRVISRMLDVMFTVPGLLVAVIAAAILGTGFWVPVAALTVTYMPYIARIVHSAAIRECRLPYVEACQLAGLSSWRICTRHILRNIAPLAVAQATLAFAWALMDFGAISFLGLGLQPPAAEWGSMVNEGRADLLTGAIWESMTAGVLIVLAAVSFNILGERLAARIGDGS